MGNIKVDFKSEKDISASKKPSLYAVVVIDAGDLVHQFAIVSDVINLRNNVNTWIERTIEGKIKKVDTYKIDTALRPLTGEQFSIEVKEMK